MQDIIEVEITGAAPGGALPTPAQQAVLRRRRRWAMVALCFGGFVTILDMFIVNVAIPSIRDGLGANFAQIQLVLVGYDAAYGVSLMNGARLGDLFGRRRLLLIGIGLFTLASLACGLAPTPLTLIIARVIQGTGAALLTPQVMASIRVLFDGAARRRAFGIMGAVQGVAAMTSQLIGGALIEFGPPEHGWRLIFLVNLPIGIAALFVVRRFVDESRAPVAARVDFAGAAIGAAGLAMFLLPIMEGRQYGWPWWSIVVPLLSIPLFMYFVRYERALSTRGGVPIIDMDLFHNKTFVNGGLGMLLLYTSVSSFFLSLTIFLQTGLGMPPLLAGAVFAPSAAAFFIGSLLGPRLAHWIGHKALLAGIGIYVIGIALAAVAAWYALGSMSYLLLALTLNGLGQGIAIPLAYNTVLGRVDLAHAGMASGAISTLQSVGASVGVVIIGLILFSLIDSGSVPSLVDRHAMYSHAFGLATLYNVCVSSVSILMFWWASRRTVPVAAAA
ncbi:MAG: MFS transporter [Janthinobacterium lividum]